MLKRWTKEEIELLRENYKKPKEELLRLFPNRSWISIDHKIFRLGLSRIHQKIELVCPQCGKHFFVNPCEIKRGRRFCSKKCSNLYKNLNYNPTKNPLIREKLIKRLKEYYKTHQVWNKGLTKETDIRVKKISEKLKGRVKSIEERENISKARKKYFETHKNWNEGRTIKKIVKCKQCGKEFLAYPSEDRKFCSKSCATTYRDLTSNPSWKGGKLTKICKFCGKEFKTYDKEGKFCSRSCAMKYRNSINKPSLNLEVRRKISETRKRLLREGKISMPWKGKPRSKEQMEKLRLKLKLLWQNKEYRERIIRNTLKAMFKRPTKLEQKFIKFFNENNLPFKYVGDGSFLIGYKNPDFIETNGRKICIEVSDEKFRINIPKETKEEYEQKRIKHFAKYGWKCLVLWEDELNNKNEIIQKINSLW
jgi:endogenous inhibitor of DNA gyrase (YacG/DUF329 family)/very-short-patch-repair endonuclease